ncbi:glycoside hydrolase family 13 protein [Allonocardiopsis opalescens]|uniref:Alpha-glucosidase n=1 Tax=Allonocardiopsis opalescens TaxID=1144618 RepID=A0A2T0QE66_9ACTN|nr:glycoside hydrolase family 13 protein [Allonocardiopsis opalescens]PRY02234.1 alpha-glucosidase [Allonocardiopsis opalescens]
MPDVPAAPAPATDAPWWRRAAIYQVYPRSFADGDGDGVGDLPGLRARLPYLARLGVDAIWMSPWYPSPLADGGYDVADYRDIHPAFGSLGEAEKLIAAAHDLGIRIIIDIVPNHCSDEHPWFQAALAAGPGSPERARFWFRPGRGPGGAEPPTNWRSRFGGPAWTRVTEPDGAPGEWYLHLYSREQPDFNWEHPQVRAEFEDILRFWFDRGVDGFRIDVADGLVKDPSLPDVLPQAPEEPFSDLDGVHEIYRSWRRIADGYPGERVFVGEMWLPDRERFARYLRADELHSAFNFDFLSCPWDPAALREVIDATRAAHAPVGAPATWVLSNHDVTRHVTRYGRERTSFEFADRQHGAPTDRALGTRRARAAALLTMALPGCVYVYQGEELGLWEVEDLPDELRQDPVWERSGRTDRGRDGCRVPLPWSGGRPPFGFGPDGADAQPWLPQPAEWAGHTAEAQAGDPGSMLELYRAALRLRREEPALGDGGMRWLPAPEGVLAFSREPGFACVVNLGAAAAALPGGYRPVLASGPLDGGGLPPDTAVWLRTND